MAAFLLERVNLVVNRVAVHLQSVSYTHLDVYKRQLPDLVVLHSQNSFYMSETFVDSIFSSDNCIHLRLLKKLHSLLLDIKMLLLSPVWRAACAG